MKLLLTSAGISNASINDALVELLGKPVSDSSALFLPTAIYPFLGGGHMAYQAICGTHSALCGLGWKSLGLLELTALPSIDRKAWLPSVEEADAILVWGGDPLYLAYWMRQSGLLDILPLLHESVYVGVSAGSIVTASCFGETYSNEPNGPRSALTTEDIVFDTPGGPIRKLFVTAQGAGLVDFGLIPHFDEVEHPNASAANAEKWAARLPGPVYAIDDRTAIKVSGDAIDVVSEGEWKRFNAS
jgi:dipeptidase E